MVTSDLKHKCSDCQKAFNRPSKLKRHVNSVHNKSKLSKETKTDFKSPKGANTFIKPMQKMEIEQAIKETEVTAFEKDKNVFEYENLSINQENIEAKMDINREDKHIIQFGILHDSSYLESNVNNMESNPTLIEESVIVKDGLLSNERVTKNTDTSDPTFDSSTFSLSLKTTKDVSQNIQMQPKIRGQTGGKFVCKFCDKAVWGRSFFILHMKLLHRKVYDEETDRTFDVRHDSYECGNCEKTFSKLCQVKTHYSFVHDQNGQKCHVCQQEFRELRTMRRHIEEVHSGMKPFKCDVCNKCFSRPEPLKTHKCENINHSPSLENILQPSDSDPPKNSKGKVSQKFKEADEYANASLSSMKKVTYKGKFKCKFCGISIKSKCLFISHMKEMHDEVYDEETNRSFVFRNDNYECDSCDKTFPKFCFLKRHFDFVHRKIGHKCKGCMRFFSNLVRFQNHKCVKKTKDFQCEHCKRFYQNEKSLHQHIQIVHKSDEPRIKCEFESCHKTFARNNLYKRHYEHYHEMAKKIQCPECPTYHYNEPDAEMHKIQVHCTHKCISCKVELQGMSQLKEHVENFHREKAYLCYRCDKPIYEVGSLNRHLPKCKKDRVQEIKCELCGINFTRPWSLRQHFATVHERKTTTKCHQCDKTFARADGLKNHLKNNSCTTTKPTCQYCQKTFRKELTLQSHIDTVHKKLKIFKCNLCDMSFSRKTSIPKHMMSVHKISNNK